MLEKSIAAQNFALCEEKTTKTDMRDFYIAAQKFALCEEKTTKTDMRDL